MGVIGRWLGIDSALTTLAASNERLMLEVLKTSQAQNEALVAMTSLMTKMSETWVPSGIPQLRDDEDYRLMMEEERNARAE